MTWLYFHLQNHSDLSVKCVLEGSKTRDSGIVEKAVELVQGHK